MAIYLTYETVPDCGVGDDDGKQSQNSTVKRDLELFLDIDERVKMMTYKTNRTTQMHQGRRKRKCNCRIRN